MSVVHRIRIHCQIIYEMLHREAWFLIFLTHFLLIFPHVSTEKNCPIKMDQSSHINKLSTINIVLFIFLLPDYLIIQEATNASSAK
jgi:hypothetical protein